MNIMTDVWTTFECDQGQIVVESYKCDYDTNEVICRTLDQSDNSVSFERATCPENLEWVGSEMEFPGDRLDWRVTDK